MFGSYDVIDGTYLMNEFFLSAFSFALRVLSDPKTQDIEDGPETAPVSLLDNASY